MRQQRTGRKHVFLTSKTNTKTISKKHSMYGAFTYIWLIFMVNVNIKIYVNIPYTECLGMSNKSVCFSPLQSERSRGHVTYGS